MRVSDEPRRHEDHIPEDTPDSPSEGCDTLTIQAAARDDQPRVIATLVSAFIADPVERWLYPESSAYLTKFPAFVAAFGGAAFDNQTVWSLDEFAAGAM